MPKKLFKWMAKTITKKEPLPVLPKNRPRVLTPSHSRETLILSAAAATANSAFFQKLPFEIRRQILKEAFGNYVVHMDLNYDFPVVPLHIRQRHPIHKHANTNGRDTLPPQSKFGLPINKKWQWWSSICHRDSPSWLEPRMSTRPCNDECRDASYNLACDKWPGNTPGKCFIGVIGWLLSCRQSYTECIDILYSTNMIHMANPVLMCHLPELLLPQRLASITSVEMIWNIDVNNFDYSDPQYKILYNLIDKVQAALPRLKRLYISLPCDININIASEEDSTNDSGTPTASLPIDNLVREMSPHLEECIIALPHTIYRARFKRDREQDEGQAIEPFHEPNRYWHKLPQIEIKSEVPTRALQGYWITQGTDDDFYPFVCGGPHA